MVRKIDSLARVRLAVNPAHAGTTKYLGDDRQDRCRHSHGDNLRLIVAGGRRSAAIDTGGKHKGRPNPISLLSYRAVGKAYSGAPA